MSMRTPPSRKPRSSILARQRMGGVVLIEVMIALLIFMFGVLGLVGLQASVTRAETASKVRADAGYLASDIVGRLWADRSHLSLYNGATCASTAYCKEWQDKVAAALPGGTGTLSVVLNGTTGAYDVTVTIAWTGQGGQQHTYATNTSVV